MAWTAFGNVTGNNKVASTTFGVGTYGWNPNRTLVIFIGWDATTDVGTPTLVSLSKPAEEPNNWEIYQIDAVATARPRAAVAVLHMSWSGPNTTVTATFSAAATAKVYAGKIFAGGVGLTRDAGASPAVEVGDMIAAMAVGEGVTTNTPGIFVDGVAKTFTAIGTAATSGGSTASNVAEASSHLSVSAFPDGSDIAGGFSTSATPTNGRVIAVTLRYTAPPSGFTPDWAGFGVPA